MTFSQEMRRAGRVPELAAAGPGRSARRPPPRPTASASRAGEPVVDLRRLRLADGEPIALETAVLDRRLRRRRDDAPTWSTGSLHEALGAGRHRASAAATGTIAAAAATAEDARLLGMPAGDPLLVERRVIADGHGRRIEATESRYPADRYALDVAVRGRGARRARRRIERRAPSRA